jgi:hypothetical protein
MMGFRTLWQLPFISVADEAPPPPLAARVLYSLGLTTPLSITAVTRCDGV